jgi:pimeloyl-ACP methyl ester carboxylesterase
MSLIERLQALPTLGVALPYTPGPGGFIRYREFMGAPTPSPPLVLLHGIGSGSGNWLHQLTDGSLGRVLAWDAPGYADSTPLKKNEPVAQDYAHMLWAWLDALQIQDVHLVGHSLGCIMAASAAQLQPARVKALTLLAPAQGYASAPMDVREKKRDERLQALAQLGVQKMAEQRAARLLSVQADAEQVQLAKHVMSRLNEGGYTQATHMLSAAAIRPDLQAFRQASAAPIQVACGDQDVITPPKACRELAEFIAAPYTELAGAGHLCALQAPQAIASLLSQGPSHA